MEAWNFDQTNMLERHGQDKMLRVFNFRRFFRNALNTASAPGQQIDDDHRQRYHQQQVDQASGHMQAEA
jgi:hypothetical protein